MAVFIETEFPSKTPAIEGSYLLKSHVITGVVAFHFP